MDTRSGAHPQGGGAARGASHNARAGAAGETIAAAWLERRGMRVIDRNWRCELGEIDIVALDGRDVVAVEVKTRTCDLFGVPVAQVTRPKVARLRQLVLRWLDDHRDSVGHRAGGVRVDVVGVLVEPTGEVSVDHRPGVS